MASGVIIGNCPICNEFIWEDDDFTVMDDALKHRECMLTEKIQDLSKMVMRLSEQNRMILTEVLNVLLLSQEREG